MSNKTIEVVTEMNRLWKMYRESRDKRVMDAFVQCQHWLSSRKIDYYQEPQPPYQWKIGVPDRVLHETC